MRTTPRWRQGGSELAIRFELVSLRIEQLVEQVSEVSHWCDTVGGLLEIALDRLK